jgi:hypothetical protein
LCKKSSSGLMCLSGLGVSERESNVCNLMNHSYDEYKDIKQCLF